MYNVISTHYCERHLHYGIVSEFVFWFDPSHFAFVSRPFDCDLSSSTYRGLQKYTHKIRTREYRYNCFTTHA